MLTIDPENTDSENTDLGFIEEAAEKIKQQLNTGEIMQACCMSAISTPVTESWDMAEELSKRYPLTPIQQKILFAALKSKTQQELQAAGFDDFDLIYERLLQLVLVP